jgi:Tfp pilus assembly protein PilO
MGKNILPIILIVLAAGIYFTYTSGQIDVLKEIQTKNASYSNAIGNARDLIAKRDTVNKAYGQISPEDAARLDKMLPDNIDNVRLIIDVNGIGARHGLTLRGLRTSAGSEATAGTKTQAQTTAMGTGAGQVGVVTVSFSVSTTYDNFISFIQDVERSLRIMDISKVTLSANDNGVYDYGVELKTYWLKQ